MRLSGKNAIITGGAGSIGSVVAERFLEEGANVLIVDRDENAIDSTLKKLKKGANTISGLQVDVTSEEGIKNMVHDLNSD